MWKRYLEIIQTKYRIEYTNIIFQISPDASTPGWRIRRRCRFDQPGGRPSWRSSHVQVRTWHLYNINLTCFLPVVLVTVRITFSYIPVLTPRNRSVATSWPTPRRPASTCGRGVANSESARSTTRPACQSQRLSSPSTPTASGTPKTNTRHPSRQI